MGIIKIEEPTDRIIKIEEPIVEHDKIIILGKSYNIHPIYNLYAANEDGFISNIN